MIKVQKFGPLENVTFNLSPMMIFTGKSSLGKSYANYLVYYFLYMVCNAGLRKYVKDVIDKGVPQNVFVFDLDAFLNELTENVEVFMRKFLGDDKLKCVVAFNSNKRKRTLPFELVKVENTIDLGKTDDQILHQPQLYELKIDDGPKRVFPDLDYAMYFIELKLKEFVIGTTFSRAIILPPGRGAFAGENFSLKSEVASSLNMYNYFFRDYDFGYNNTIHFSKESEQDLSDRLLDLTSGGRIISVDGKQYLQINDSEKIALSAGASSVKDLAPWLFYLKNHWMLPLSICLEEPEAHQHPSVTVQIADVMAISMHLRNGNMFHLTTHSDYLIQRINQLIKLGSIRRRDIRVFSQICKERGLDINCYLDSKDIKAYYFTRNDKGKTVVEDLSVTDDGIPMKSFFEVVSDLEDREEYINEAIYRLSKD